MPPSERSGHSVGVVGSGPAGLAVAAELNRHGHTVSVYERDEGPGGLLRFGVPDAKLEKWIIDRRVALLEQEGIVFEYGVDVGRDVTAAELRERHDALVMAIGSRVHRELDVPGRRAGRRALRDGVPLPAQPPRGPARGPHRAGACAGRGDQRRRQARGGGGRRRHRHGLHLQRAARGRGRRAAAGRLPAAAGRGPPGRHALAAAAQAHALDLRARRGRRAPLRHPGDRPERGRGPA